MLLLGMELTRAGSDWSFLASKLLLVFAVRCISRSNQIGNNGQTDFGTFRVANPLPIISNTLTVAAGVS